MKHSYLYASASFNTALIDLVKQRRRDLFDNKHTRARMLEPAPSSIAVHGPQSRSWSWPCMISPSQSSRSHLGRSLSISRLGSMVGLRVTLHNVECGKALPNVSSPIPRGNLPKLSAHVPAGKRSHSVTCATTYRTTSCSSPKSELERHPNAIARTRDFIFYRKGVPAWAPIDFDTKGMPPEIAALIREAGGLWALLCQYVPGLANAAHVIRASTSAGLYNVETGEPILGSDGLHIYILIADGADAQRLLYNLHDRLWLAGFGWHVIGKRWSATRT